MIYIRIKSSNGKPGIINSDQGSQYTCYNWEKHMSKSGIKISMDGKGSAIYNALLERSFRTIKQEYIYLIPTSKVSELRNGISHYIDYYIIHKEHIRVFIEKHP